MNLFQVSVKYKDFKGTSQYEEIYVYTDSYDLAAMSAKNHAAAELDASEIHIGSIECLNNMFIDGREQGS